MIPEAILEYIKDHPEFDILKKTFLALSEEMKKEAEDYFLFADTQEKEAIIQWILHCRDRLKIPSAAELESWYSNG